MDNISGKKRELSVEEKRIMAEVNQMHFHNFKRHKLDLYNALIKCALKMNDQSVYYDCTDSVLSK